MSAYRGQPKPDEAYSVQMRVWPCDACGKPLVVGFRGGSVSCGACGADTLVLDPVDLTQPHTTMDELERQQQLASRTGEQRELHPSAMKYAEVLDGELPQVRRAWGEARQAFARRQDDENAAHLFFSMTIALLNELPTTPEHELDRRAVCEATAEMCQDASRRQKMLGNLSCGAARAGDRPSARQWMQRMDPRSADLLADTAHRQSQAFLATAEERWADVLTHLGAEAGVVPIASSQDVIATMLRANAYEKLGDLPRASNELLATIRKNKRALAVFEVISLKHQSWKLCESTLPKVRAQVLPAFAKHLRRRMPQLSAWIPFMAAALSLMFVLYELLWLTVICAVAAAILGAVSYWLRSRVSRVALGSLVVEGRVIALEPLGGNRGRYHVVMDPADGTGQVSATVEEAIPPPLTAETCVGCAFDGYWNPDYPHLFVFVMFQIGALPPPPPVTPGSTLATKAPFRWVSAIKIGAVIILLLGYLIGYASWTLRKNADEMVSESPYGQEVSSFIKHVRARKEPPYPLSSGPEEVATRSLEVLRTSKQHRVSNHRMRSGGPNTGRACVWTVHTLPDGHEARVLFHVRERAGRWRVHGFVRSCDVDDRIAP